MSTDFRALVVEMADELDLQRRFLRGKHDDCITHPLADRARAALAEPPSLKEQALKSLNDLEHGADPSPSDYDTIRRALEGGND